MLDLESQRRLKRRRKERQHGGTLKLCGTSSEQHLSEIGKHLWVQKTPTNADGSYDGQHAIDRTQGPQLLKDAQGPRSL